MVVEADAPSRPAVNGPEIRVLRPGDVAALRLGGYRRVGPAEVRALAESYPGRSVWAPESLEFALLAPWRHREEIAVVQELAAVRHAAALLAAAVERCRTADAALVLMIEMDETRRQSFYTRAGFDPIEQVITYELDGVRPAPVVPGGLTFQRVRPMDTVGLAELVRIDHAAFPWLWWNSGAEFAAYGQTAGVQLYLGRRAGRPVAYVGVTTYAGWGHLDRIAVEPAAQGEGLGRQALAFAVGTLAQQGARRVALSTQR